MRLIIEASRIRVGASVTKVTGTKRYILRDTVTVYSKNTEVCPQQKLANAGVRFLVDPELGHIEAIAATQELSWPLTGKELRKLLEDLVDEEEGNT